MQVYWMRIHKEGPNDNVVRYGIPNSGAYDTHVDDTTARLLKLAIAAGQAEKAEELRLALNLNPSS